MEESEHLDHGVDSDGDDAQDLRSSGHMAYPDPETVAAYPWRTATHTPITSATGSSGRPILQGQRRQFYSGSQDESDSEQIDLNDAASEVVERLDTHPRLELGDDHGPDSTFEISEEDDRYLVSDATWGTTSNLSAAMNRYRSSPIPPWNTTDLHLK